MKFAVTGGAGFIGSNIVKMLHENDHEIIVIDNLHTGNLSKLKEIKDKIVFQKIDVRDFNNLRNSINDVDGIFHQAGLTSVPESFLKTEEYNEVNVNGTENIFKIAKEFGIKVVFASSSSVYGDVKITPINENFQKNPINPYGETKVKKEKLAEKYAKDVQIIGLRYFNVYGHGQTANYAGVITKFMKRLEENLQPKIFGDGLQSRDFIHVNDVANANLIAMNSKIKNAFYNIGTGKSTTILDLAKIMAKIYNKKLFPIFDKKLDGDIMKSQADTSLAKKEIGWTSKIEICEGLKNLITNKIIELKD